MNESECLTLHEQLRVLVDVLKDYPGKTIENVIVQIGARIREYEEQNFEL